MTFAVVVVTTDGCAGKKITFVLLSGTFVIEIFVLLIRSKNHRKDFIGAYQLIKSLEQHFLGFFEVANLKISS